jgi:hypothetical protein
VSFRALALRTSVRHTFGEKMYPRADVVRLICDVKFRNMDRKELEVEVEVERILLKKAHHRKLTKREELILAYTHYAAGCSTCYAMVKVQQR